MELSEQSYSALAAAFREAVSGYAGGDENSAVTDIHVQPNSDSGELLVFNDDEEELARAIIEEWVNYESDDFYNVVEPVLKKVLTALKDEGVFEHLSLLKPYSFVLVDDEKETVCELLLLDDDTLLLDGELLKGLDEELDAFLKDLLEK